MATLIPAISTCVSRMTPGERRTAERLEQKLDADYLLWYDVAVGPLRQHPDFVVMHPRRGILILEVKDFRLSTLIQANKHTWDIHSELGPKTIPNPLEQARQYAHQVVHALERDPQLVQPEGRHQGKLARRCNRRSTRPAGWRVPALGHRVVQIPCGQHQAVMIDEGHDFAHVWLKLITQMVDLSTNSLLVLYDDAQSIYEHMQKSKNVSFKSVGIQAQGRTTILKINYRNTRQILHTASLVAAEHVYPHAPSLRGSLPPKGADPAWGGPAPDRPLTAEDKDDDGVPLLKPVSCGRDGDAQLIIRLPILREEVAQVAELLITAHREGHAWADMAILCRHHSEMDMCAEFLRKRKLPHQLRRNSSSVCDPAHDSIKVMTLHVSKGLEFPVVALVGAGHMPAEGEDEREEARLLYVGATRATQWLVIGASGGGKFAVGLWAKGKT